MRKKENATCPNCGKPANGRICGYCGASLVENYFSSNTKATEQYPTAGMGNMAATVIGIFGGLTILAGAAFQGLTAFPPGSPPTYSPGMDWWVRLLAAVFCGALFFVQQVVLRGLRFSLVFDGCWLFVSTFGLGLSLLGFLAAGSKAFYGSGAVSWLIIIGCALCVISCILGIIVYKRPE